MLLNGDKVRLRKLRAADDPSVRTPTKEEHTAGEQNPTTSLPVDYEMEGVLLADIKEGEGLRMFRTKRNGIEVQGITETSRIVGMNLDEGGNSFILETKNSIYAIQKIGNDD